MENEIFRENSADSQRDFETLECYRLNKILMRIIGQWPFSPLWQQRLAVAIFLCSIGNFYILEIAYFISNGNNFDEMISCLAPAVINTGAFIKLGTLFIGAKSVRRIFVQIHEDWITIKGTAEKKILQQYADNSKFLTLTYAVYMYFFLLVYYGIPGIPVLLNYIQRLNESHQKILPAHVKYFIDEPTEYYWPLFIHQFLGSFSVMTIVITCDTAYVTFVQYVCGIFASLNYKLNHLTDEEGLDEDFNAPKEKSRTFAKAVNCIDHHRKAIQFAELVENTYSFSNLMVMVGNVFVISMTGFQTIIHLGHTEAVVRFGSDCVGLFIHVFFISLPGQALRDHSSSTFHAAYNCKWYSMSKKSRDLLRFITLRSLAPCQLTAGKFYVMDLQRFSMVVKTSMSYCMVLISMR